MARTLSGNICTAMDYTMTALFNYKLRWDGNSVFIVSGNITEGFNVWRLIILSYLVYRVPVGV
jgi:hypothetical protein